MAYHHVALAAVDIGATHRFYTDAMGFELVKSVVGPTPEGGWARHVFYDTGDGALIAFWDLHVDALPLVKGAISTDLGLPQWVNHLAFDAADDAALNACLERWLGLGLDVFDVNHGFCRSIYTTDPNGTLVEWCQNLRPFTPEERTSALATIGNAEPGPFDADPNATAHWGDRSLRPDWALAL